ncbi:uncharacterized protein LOC136032460 [Artemia franciscana]|uniref:uncharacterized protein LOC136032460 n=1 Tax=Artemia franciscana TaxID=6661 RepID=UPI0032DBC1AD
MNVNDSKISRPLSPVQIPRIIFHLASEDECMIDEVLENIQNQTKTIKIYKTNMSTRTLRTRSSGRDSNETRRTIARSEAANSRTQQREQQRDKLRSIKNESQGQTNSNVLKTAAEKRKERLEKYLEQKKIKKDMERKNKKPAFVVGVVHHKPFVFSDDHSHMQTRSQAIGVAPKENTRGPRSTNNKKNSSNIAPRGFVFTAPPGIENMEDSLNWPNQVTTVDPSNWDFIGDDSGSTETVLKKKRRETMFVKTPKVSALPCLDTVKEEENVAYSPTLCSPLKRKSISFLLPNNKSEDKYTKVAKTPYQRAIKVGMDKAKDNLTFEGIQKLSFDIEHNFISTPGAPQTLNDSCGGSCNIYSEDAFPNQQKDQATPILKNRQVLRRSCRNGASQKRLSRRSFADQIDDEVALEKIQPEEILKPNNETDEHGNIMFRAKLEKTPVKSCENGTETPGRRLTRSAAKMAVETASVIPSEKHPQYTNTPRKQKPRNNRKTEKTTQNISGDLPKDEVTKLTTDKTPNIREERSSSPAEVSCSDLLSITVVETSKPKSILKTRGLSAPESPSTCASKIDRVSPIPKILKPASLEDIEHFRTLLLDEEKRLEEAKQKWNKVLNEDKDFDFIPEDHKGEISVAIGKTKMVLQDHFIQFESILKMSETDSSKRITTAEDLEGFWEMIKITIKEVDKRLERLEVLKENEWKETPKTPKLKKRNKKAISKVAKETVKRNSNLKDFIAQRRRQCNPKKEEPEVGLFDPPVETPLHNDDDNDEELKPLKEDNLAKACPAPDPIVHVTPVRKTYSRKGLGGATPNNSNKATPKRKTKVEVQRDEIPVVHLPAEADNRFDEILSSPTYHLSTPKKDQVEHGTNVKPGLSSTPAVEVSNETFDKEEEDKENSFGDDKENEVSTTESMAELSYLLKPGLWFDQRADTSAVTYVPSPMSSPVKNVERRRSGRQSSIHSVRRSSRISLLPGMKERLSPIQTTEGEDLIHF